VNPFVVIGYIYGFLGPPIEWALTHLTRVYESVPVLSHVGAFGVAIVTVTLVIRSLLFPLFGWQLRTQRRIQAEQRIIAPQLQALRKKYRREPQKLQEEMMKLYREHGISPFSGLTGCLPLLVQLPIIYGLYSGIRNATATFHGHAVGFLWIDDLSRAPREVSLGSHPGYLVLPVLAALATFVQSRMMMQPPRPDMSDQERQMYNLSRNMMFIAPAMVLLFAFQLPEGIALYWVTQSIFMIVQQWYVLGWGGLKVPSWFPGAGRVTPLSFGAAPAPVAATPGGGDGRGRSASGSTAPSVVAASARAPGHGAATARGRAPGGQARGKRHPAPGAAARRRRGR
jgi:YidC/Oxa1 family membrane protein insertase